MTSLMSHRHHRDGQPTDMKADRPAGAGSAEMRPPSHPLPPPPPVVEEEQSDAAGEAAIITAIATGIAGLLGAITQTVLAFVQVKQRRSKDDQS
jgi:hypothetical protein